MTRRRAHDELRPTAQSAALQRLLADASAPALPGELDGLSAATAAFTATRRKPVKTLIATLLAAKAVAASAATVTLGGVALAAASGALPPPAQNAAHDLVGAPAASSPATTDTVEPTETPDANKTPDTTETSASTDSQEAPKASATPSPSLVGLCRAYGAGVATSAGKALANPAFTVLITAAKGQTNVPDYCATLLATAPGGRPTAKPTQATAHKPATHPAGKPTTHATGKPAPAPAPHATGKPATNGGGPAAHATGSPEARS
ncbi:MAG: hypothetical protein H7233_10355 [Pseudorhodobacter sp.]|nr:hypothetical protein [Frankiaceae bacterium]